MAKTREPKEPPLFAYRVLDDKLTAQVFTIEGNAVLPEGETTLEAGTRIEVIKFQGKTTAIGLLNERRTSRTQQMTMMAVSSRLLFFRSSPL